MVAPRPYQTTTRNVNMMERWFSMIGGGALLTSGLRRGGVPGLILTLIGGYFAQRGLTGHCAIYESLGLSTAPSIPYTVDKHEPIQPSKTGSTRAGKTPGSAEGERSTVEADLSANDMRV